MLKLHIPETELFNSATSEITKVKETTLTMEHSLLSLSKWEERWEKPFLSTDKQTYDEIIDYARCMTITSNVDDNVYLAFKPEHIKEIQEYINKPATATTINDPNDNKKSREIITSELIYCWMTQLEIPFECQKWHLNRLMTLIRVCSIKNSPPKKMGKKDVLKQYSQLNAARRKAHK